MWLFLAYGLAAVPVGRGRFQCSLWAGIRRPEVSSLRDAPARSDWQRYPWPQGRFLRNRPLGPLKKPGLRPAFKYRPSSDALREETSGRLTSARDGTAPLPTGTAASPAGVIGGNQRGDPWVTYQVESDLPGGCGWQMLSEGIFQKLVVKGGEQGRYCGATRVPDVSSLRASEDGRYLKAGPQGPGFLSGPGGRFRRNRPLGPRVPLPVRASGSVPKRGDIREPGKARNPRPARP